MKAALYTAPGRIELAEVDVPEIGADDLLVRVRAASICGTDLRIFQHGHFKIPAGTRRVLGHELAGEVVAAGERVRGYPVGTRVAVAPNVGDGTCDMCRRGLNNMCPRYEAFGVSLDGGFQEYMRIPGFALQQGNVFALPDGVDWRAAALVEPLSCAWHGMDKLGVGADDVVVIVGAGPIGLLHLLLSRVLGARRTIVASSPGPRLALARELGADVVVDVRAERLEEVVRRETGGRGADVVVTCVSKPEVMSESIGLLATLGRVNFFGGLGRGADVPIDANRVHYGGLLVTGTTGSRNADYAASLRLVADGRVDLARLVTRTFPFARVQDAFAAAASKQEIKVMLLDEERAAR